MAYAQRNYGQIQGISGRYTIAQIGCFITSFCNLLERYGIAVNPAQMNDRLRDRGLYIDVDDGIRDDVGWGTITGYDGSVVVTGTGSGTPPHNNCIVKFNYRSPNTGQFTTHFCLVADRNAGTIVDSWDGVVKPWSVYGGPIAWASYTRNVPQPVQPVNQGDIPMNQGDVVNLYRTLLERDPDPSGLAHYTGMSWHDGFYDIANSKERQQLLQNKANQLAGLQEALRNEQNKPPQVVVKEVEKVVEKIKEVPVEAPVDPDAIVIEKNTFWSWIRNLIPFKKG